MLSRRDLLKLAALSPAVRAEDAEYVNDIHSQLNRTRVRRVVRPSTVEVLRREVLLARESGASVSVAGGRHSMGGQQFAAESVNIDTRGFDRVLSLDIERGVVEVGAGIQWPKLLAHLESSPWGIIQKQTGADRLSIGGALASNVHGRGLTLKPIIDQVESFELLMADGEVRRCDRKTNTDLFKLAIGGYGLFGILITVKLRLARRRKVQRIVERRRTIEIPELFEQRIRDGYLYGDFQYATDRKRDSFLRQGLFPTYRPADDMEITKNQKRFHPGDWERLTYWTHRNKRLAFGTYSKRYVETSGQVYWSDSQLSAAYVDNYHESLDRKLKARVKGTEMITEIYVPRAGFVAFMEEARRFLRDRKADVIYGTVRVIEADQESFLAWAREGWACIVLNLHIDHTPGQIEHAAETFRGLIDLAIAARGSFYLTYHRWASRRQVEACYPQFAEFLRLKQKHDPRGLFQSEWYRHYSRL